MFPFNADRIRLGYTYRITWGGNNIFPTNTTGAPGMKIGWDGEHAYAYAGLKTHRQENYNNQRMESVYAVLGGFGIDFTPYLRWEANGGIFQKGVFWPENTNVDAKAITAEGASTRVTVYQGLPVQQSIDVRLYRNDPNFAWVAFPPEKYDSGWSWLVSAEATYLTQNLRDADNPDSTVMQAGKAGDLTVRIKKGFAKLTADAMYRDLAFILTNVPSLTPYTSFLKSSTTTPEWFVDLGVDYYLQDLRLDPGIMIGYQHPSTYLGDNGALSTSLAGQVNTVVVRNQGDFTILPAHQGAYDIVSTRLYTRWDLSYGMSMAIQLTYTYDKNATKLQTAPDGTVQRVFDKTGVINQFGGAFICQARF
jgi:hypothetical protein